MVHSKYGEDDNYHHKEENKREGKESRDKEEEGKKRYNALGYLTCGN